MNKRYEAIFVTPNFCDGFWDNKETRYLDIDEIKEKIYENLDDYEIEEVLNRNMSEDKNNNKKESSIGLALEGLGILGLTLFSLIWYLIKIISIIMITGLISTRLGLSGYYWWYSYILIFCVLMRIIFYGNKDTTLNGMMKNYSEKVREDNEDNE